LINIVSKMWQVVSGLRKGLRDASRESNHLDEITMLRQLLTSSPDIVFVKDNLGHYLASNPAHAELVGVPNDEIIGRHDLQLHPDSDVVRYNLSTDMQVISTGEIYQATGQPIPFRGELRYFDIVKSPLYTDSGEIVGIIGVARDITRLHLIEKRLRNKSAYLSEFNQSVLSLSQGAHAKDSFDTMLEAAIAMLDVSFSALYLATGTNNIPELTTETGERSAALQSESQKIAQLAWCSGKKVSQKIRVGGTSSESETVLHALLITTGEDNAGIVVFSSSEHTQSTDADEDMQQVCDHLSMALTQKKLLIEVEHRAYHDAVTDLANRYSFEQSIDQYLTEALQNEQTFSLAFMDLDGFKEVNDTMGHDAGDQLLRSIGKRLSCSVRECDTLARIGGDEFALLISDIEDHAAAEIIANDIEHLFQKPFYIDGAKQVSVGVSIGLSTYPQDGKTSSELIVCADRAMYKAKSGKGRRIGLAA